MSPVGRRGDVEHPDRRPVRPLFAPPPPTSGELGDRVERWTRHKVPVNTRNSYGDWQRRYETDYCPLHERDPYPCDAAQLADFVSWLAETGTKPLPGRPRQAYSPNSLLQAIKAVVRRHRDEGWDAPDPARARDVVDGYRRWMLDQDWTERRVDPLRRAHLMAAVADIDLGRPAGLRDRAILLTGWWTFRRAATVSAWNMSDVVEHESGGLVLRVRTSKTDQLGHKDDFATLERGPAGICPVEALTEWMAWLRSQGVRSGPMFRQMNKPGTGLYVHPRARSTEARRGRMSTEALREVVDRRLMAAKVAWLGDFTYHSLRAGGAGDARRRGWPPERICAQGGWSPTSPEWMRYLRDIERWAGDAFTAEAP